MKSAVFILGSLAASAVSWGVVSTVYRSHVGGTITFYIFGICGGFALAVAGTIGAFIEGRSKKVQEQQRKTLKNEALRLVPWFLVPFSGLLGFAWLFSLQTSAT